DRTCETRRAGVDTQTHETEDSCQQKLAREGEVERDSVGHDVFDPCLEIRAGDTGVAWNGRGNIEPAYFQNAFGVHLAVVAGYHDGLITGALALVDQPRADPPNGRIEPEHGFDQHVERGSQIVPAPQVAELVRENRLQLQRSQVFQDTGGQEKNRA